MDQQRTKSHYLHLLLSPNQYRALFDARIDALKKLEQQCAKKTSLNSQIADDVLPPLLFSILAHPVAINAFAPHSPESVFLASLLGSLMMRSFQAAKDLNDHKVTTRLYQATECRLRYERLLGFMDALEDQRSHGSMSPVLERVFSQWLQTDKDCSHIIAKVDDTAIAILNDSESGSEFGRK